jgi:5'-3' exonuclease
MTSTLLVIDTSYLIFFRFHAVKSWITRAKPDVEIDKTDDITTIPEFMDTYRKTFFKTVQKIMKINNITMNNVVFARDCSGADIWRNMIFSEYKQNRDYSNFNGKTIFKWTYENLLPEYIEKGAKTARFDYIEADDIAAIITMEIKDRPILIITNDNDYLQLCVNSNVKLINLKEEDITSRSIGSPNADLMKKIILGDPSDNIPKVFNKCGIKTLEKYLSNPQLLEDALKQDTDANKRFKLNRVLVDFNQIPQIYKNEVIEWININI